MTSSQRGNSFLGAICITNGGDHIVVTLWDTFNAQYIWFNVADFKQSAKTVTLTGVNDDYEIIKVITGVRRCGKSSLMETIAKETV